MRYVAWCVVALLAYGGYQAFHAYKSPWSQAGVLGMLPAAHAGCDAACRASDYVGITP